MTPVSFADHFSTLAREYASFRPTYPPEMIAALADLAPSRDIAWDCATGNGQAAALLAAHFRLVIATDGSPEQLARAEPHPRVRFRVALEDDSGAATATVDLVTVAQALHWLDLERFYREAARALRPGGVVAVWCYGLGRVSPEIDRVLDWFYATRVGKYWSPERRHVENAYADLPFPFEELPSGTWSMRSHLKRSELLGYVGTWSAVAKARREELRDPLEDLLGALSSIWPDEEERRTITWPVGMRIGRTSAPRAATQEGPSDVGSREKREKEAGYG